MKVRKTSKDILEILREVIFSDKIRLDYRMDKKYFSRNRKQPFGEMLLFMFNFLKKSLAIEIDNFVTILNSKEKFSAVQNFTKSAFVQKRVKINPAVFKHLSQTIIENVYTENNTTIKNFYGLRILAVDGSKLTLPKTEELKKEFGESKNHTETSVVQARISSIYDVLNCFTLDSELGKLELGEREMALKHSSYWKKNDLIIYDRGYPGYDFVNEHIKGGVDCLIRVSTTYSKIVKSFVVSKKRTTIVEMFPCQRKNIEDKEYTKETPIKIRLIRIDLPGGEIEILMTTLLDSQIYPASIFKELYFLRWGIETFYDELKNKLKVGYFTGYSKISILQDFYCAVFISNLQSLIVNDLQEELKIKNKKTKLDYKINTNLSYGFLKNRILELLFKDAPLDYVFSELESLFLENVIPIKNNRTNKREIGKYRNRIRPLVLKNQRDAI